MILGIILIVCGSLAFSLSMSGLEVLDPIEVIIGATIGAIVLFAGIMNLLWRRRKHAKSKIQTP